MQVVNNLQDLNKALHVETNKSIGFVPTMGDLHDGHLSLVQRSKEKSDFTVVSIFINPTQFDNPNDFSNYPVNLEYDLSVLKKYNIDLVFIPKFKELFQQENKVNFPLNGLDQVLEGRHRKGHFNGVLRVLNIFFKLIKPQYAFFGEKDYQQFLIVNLLAKNQFKNIEIILCPTRRLQTGLAMSSRNSRLSPDQQKIASKIYETLNFCKMNFSFSKIKELESVCLEKLKDFSDPEYFEIRNSINLSNKINKEDKCRAFVATKLSNVRLIDNLAIN
ncbi:MAG: pantoate--beta-alanine ligase [Crocinitomicaceae bacterium]|nr:pantoate--beta-alanine ligase [Crocinitomicaceae bacterium]